MTGNDELRLRPGVAAGTAIQQLSELQLRVQNIVGTGGGRRLHQYATEYLSWVEDAERSLRRLFAEPWVWQELHTSRYRDIRTLTSSTLRPVALISMEAEMQSDRLEALLGRMRAEVQSFELPPETLAVLPDTNVFLHYQPYDQIDWPKETRAQHVRLVIPELVIDELDTKTYSPAPLGLRAKRAIASLRKLRGNELPQEPVELRDNLELQVLMDPIGHIRRENNDEEILTRADHLASIVGRDRVVVATGDYGMQLRSLHRRLGCLSMPENLRATRNATVSEEG